MCMIDRSIDSGYSIKESSSIDMHFDHECP